MGTILYLHGFLSSPGSAKVTMLRDGVPEDLTVEVPDLNLAPLEADRKIADWVLSHRREHPNEALAVVGSSLGGFYAARAGARFGLRTVLLNPCFNPWEFVGNHLGRQTIYGTHRTLDVVPDFVDELKALACETSPLAVNPADTLAVFGTGDEVLDWRAGSAAYADCRQLILPGEDHRIAKFADLIPRIVDFVCFGH